MHPNTLWPMSDKLDENLQHQHLVYHYRIYSDSKKISFYVLFPSQDRITYFQFANKFPGGKSWEKIWVEKKHLTYWMCSCSSLCKCQQPLFPSLNRRKKNEFSPSHLNVLKVDEWGKKRPVPWNTRGIHPKTDALWQQRICCEELTVENFLKIANHTI